MSQGLENALDVCRIIKTDKTAHEFGKSIAAEHIRSNEPVTDDNEDDVVKAIGAEMEEQIRTSLDPALAELPDWIRVIVESYIANTDWSDVGQELYETVMEDY